MVLVCLSVTVCTRILFLSRVIVLLDSRKYSTRDSMREDVRQSDSCMRTKRMFARGMDIKCLHLERLATVSLQRKTLLYMQLLDSVRLADALTSSLVTSFIRCNP
jgi:hypothetical protein